MSGGVPLCPIMALGMALLVSYSCTCLSYKFYRDTHIRVFFPLGVGRDAELGQLFFFFQSTFL